MQTHEQFDTRTAPPRESRMSTLRWISALLVAFTTLVALPLQAQAVTLVSTLGQDTNGQQTIFSSQRVATKFTAGPDSGYTLTSVTVKRGSGGQALDVAIHAVDTNNSNNPEDTALYSFTRPSGNGSGNRTFTAPAGAALTQDTSYFVVITTNASGAQSIPVTNANGEDAGGIAGWSVANSGRKYDGSWGSAGTLRMKLEGAETTPNSAPTFDDGTSTTREFDETIGNATVTTASDIETPIAATDTNTGDMLEYTLSGTDAAKFEIISTSGQIQTKVGEKYSYETDTSYAVTVTVEDGNGGSDTIDVTLDVTDVDEPPIRPDAPGVTGHNTDVNKLLLTLTRPDNTDRPSISGYRVRLHAPGFGWTTLGWNTGLNPTIDSAISGARYTVQYRARNNEGEGPWSPSGFGSTKAHATGVPDITGTAEVTETLTAGTSGISDGNGKSKAENGETGFAYTYQWVRRVSGTDSNISGATSRTYTLTAADEGNKVKVKARFTDNAGYAEGPLTSSVFPATGTVAPEPDPVLSFANSNVPVDENAGPATLTVELDRTSTATVTVDFATSDLGIISTHATAGEDYTASSGTLTFTSGQTSKTITIPILNDTDYEQAERFRVTLSNAAGATLPATPSANISITDDETVPRASMEDVTVDEGAGTMTLTLQLSHPSQADITYVVNSSNVEGTATKGDDYEDFLLEPGGTAKITVPGGELSQTFDITIVDDSVNESDETIDIGWLKSLDDDVTPITLNFLGTITDNDTPLPELSFPSSTVSVDEEAGPAVVTVNLTPASTGTVTVDYTTRDSTAGRAKGGEDYTATSGTLTFAPGETSKTITIEILSDDIYEGLERFVTVISNPSGATLPQYPGLTIAIVSDEAVPTAQMAPVTLNEGGGTMTLTLRLSHPSGEEISYLTIDDQITEVTGTATEGDDYDDFLLEPLRGASITVPAGSVSQTFNISIVDDNLEEPDETIRILWQKDPYHTVTPDDFVFTGTIEDNDEGAGAAMGKPKIAGAAEVGQTLTVNTSGLTDQHGNTKAENGNARFAYTYQWYRVDAGAETQITGAKGRASTYTLVQADAGKTFRVEVSFTDDAGNSEGPLKSNEYPARAENGELRLADGPSDNQGRLEVFHNGEWGTMCDDRLDNRRNIAPQKACQFMGYATGQLIPRGTVSRAPDSQPIWLDDVRCFAGSNHWTGAPAEKLHHCYHAGWGNNNCSHDENVHLSCTGVSGQTEATPLTATLEDLPTNHDGSSAFTFRIEFSADVDVTPENMRDHALTVSGATVTNATRVDGRSDLWELTLEPTGSGAVSILVPLNRACTEPGALCTAQGGMLSIAPAQSIPGPAQGPQAPQGLTASFVAVPAEHDGDTEFWIELTFGAAVAQGSKSEIRALLGASGGSVRKLRRKDGRLDHWRIKIQPSSHEAVTVTLSPSPACGETGAVCTDDGRTFTTGLATQIQGPPGISVADAQVQEAANATLAFAVTLNRAPSGTVTVDYATSDGTATAGSDYTATSGTLSFAAGESEKTVSVPVFDDGHDEGSETLTLTLSNPSGAYLADGSAIGTINNSDPMPLAWMVRFGRTVGSQVVDALGQRLDSATASHVTIAGINLTGEPGTVPMENDDPFGLPDWATRRSLETNGDDITTDDLLLRSAFHISNRSDDGMGAHPAFTAWGSAARSGFEAEVDDVTMDGNVTTGLIGFDAEWERVLAGVMLSQSTGEGSYRLSEENGGRTGTVESSLTGVYPYARLELNRQVSAWALAGMGSGDLTLQHDDHKAMPTDITMRMGAVGFKGQLLDGTGASGLAMNVKSDAMWVQTKSERTTDMVATQGEVRRLRITLAGERAFAAGEGATFTPSAEVGLRHDAGDAETGTGLEMGAGLRYAAGALTVEGQVRMLVAHEDNGYEEWGASGAIRVTPSPSGRGLMLSIAPEWGRTGSTTDRLWSAHDASRLGADDEFEAEGTIAIDAGYGVGLADGHGVITPYAGLTLGDGAARTIRTGLRWQVAPDVVFGLEGTRRVDATNEGENEVRLRAALRF